MLNFTGSDPSGRKAQIRESESPYDYGYSVFTWHDSGNGVMLWSEKHEVTPWAQAYSIAAQWLNPDYSGLD